MAERLPGNLLEKPSVVYTLRAADGSALYVGLSTQMWTRFAQHHLKPWWPNVAQASFEHFADPWAARRREAELIRELLPPHNTDFTHGEPTPRRAA